MDVDRLRSLFPVTERRVFLCNAGESPLNTLVRERLQAYFDVAGINPLNKPNPRWDVKNKLAGLFGGEPSEYAVMTSTGMGIGIAALGIDWQAGDNVVVPELEHWNNTFPWLALRDKGIDVRLVPLDENNRIAIGQMEKVVDERTRVVAVAAVRFNSGLRVDLKAMSHIAHKHGAIFLVDGIQAAGVIPLNVEQEGIDVLASAGFKWLLGLPGTGFLYISKNIQKRIKPALPGMFAAENLPYDLHYFEDARRYETGSVAYSLYYAWEAGLELIEELGVENIYRRILHLTDRIIKGLKERKIEILSPIDTLEERSAILTFTVGSAEANEELQRKLYEMGIDISYRGGICRVSPSFFNTEEEIDLFLKAL